MIVGMRIGQPTPLAARRKASAVRIAQPGQMIDRKQIDSPNATRNAMGIAQLSL